MGIPQSSHLRPQSSHLRPQSSHLRPQSSHLRPQSSHLRPQVLPPPSLPKPSSLPQFNHHEDHTCKPANHDMMRTMTPMDDDTRSAKRQKLDVDGNTPSSDEVAFFLEGRDDNLDRQVRLLPAYRLNLSIILARILADCSTANKSP